ncbi:RNase P subunit p30-domain-containing protein [Tribonema minus]|uniref:RNase P subunit p30-domain-containing protein n=1 Tax=Tribonema minus TaxID=303371 RepID=A0A835ZCV8_9STRA|nr:RNase P subunit p30-domain-containing protein [Tribonema minus]
MIVIDLDSRLPYHIAAKHAASALRRNIYFEVCYGPTLRSAGARKHLINNTRGLVQFTSGRGLLLSGDANSPLQIRSPQDIANIAQLLGLSEQAALAAVSTNAQQVLLRAESRRAQHQGIMVVAEAGGVIGKGQSKGQGHTTAAHLEVPIKYYDR